ncbi:MAG TPA: uracil-DNA glycosylase [Opitutae bacterium]|jgi:DNA polymerase|nr:uracil-DNA glycosylase [Opitutae bacterium]
MSTGLDAVYVELKRLQLEGMDRVFIQDSTLALLTPAKPRIPQKPATPAHPTPAIDLQSAVQSGTKPDTPAPKSASKRPAEAMVNPLPEAPTIELPDGDASSRMQWLKEQVETSPVCQEHLRKNEQIVFGQGSIHADIFYCGDAPGEEEAASGAPFVGKSGELLSKILSAMGLDRESVYMTNILKWRPEHHKPYGNRPPTQAEMDFCVPYLKAQIEIVQPKVIIGLGNATVPGLLGPNPNRKMASIRGTWLSFEGTPLIFTFQPAYLLFNDTMKTKRMAWEDMLKAMEKVGLPISEKQQAYFLPK